MAVRQRGIYPTPMKHDKQPFIKQSFLENLKSHFRSKFTIRLKNVQEVGKEEERKKIFGKKAFFAFRQNFRSSTSF